MLQYSKATSTINPADLITKYLSADVNEGHCARLGVYVTAGGAQTAPTLGSILEGNDMWETEDDITAAVVEQSNGDYAEDMVAKFQSAINN